MKNRSENDVHSCEATEVVAKKPQKKGSVSGEEFHIGTNRDTHHIF